MEIVTHRQDTHKTGGFTLTHIQPERWDCSIRAVPLLNFIGTPAQFCRSANARIKGDHSRLAPVEVISRRGIRNDIPPDRRTCWRNAASKPEYDQRGYNKTGASSICGQGTNDWAFTCQVHAPTGNDSDFICRYAANSTRLFLTVLVRVHCGLAPICLADWN